MSEANKDIPVESEAVKAMRQMGIKLPEPAAPAAVPAPKTAGESNGDQGAAKDADGNATNSNGDAATDASKAAGENGDNNAAGDGDAAPAAGEHTALEKPVGTDVAAAEKPVVNEEGMLAFLRENGIEVSSIEQLKNLKPEAAAPLTAEEQEKVREAEEAEVARFALEHKLYTKKDIEAHAIDAARDPRDVALEVFGIAQRQLDKDITPEEIEARFADYFGEVEDEADASWRTELGKKEIQLIADKYMADKHSALSKAGDVYRDTVRVEQSAKDYSQAVTAEIDRQAAEEITIEVDGTPYKYKLHPDTVKAVKEQFQTTAQFETFGQKVPDASLLTSAMKNALRMADFERLVSTVAKSHADAILIKEKQGRLGIGVSHENHAEGNDKVYTNDNPAVDYLKNRGRN